MDSLDLAPQPGNPRNSEGAFLTLTTREVLFAWSAFRGDSARDHTTADIRLIRSADGGITWSAPVTLVTPEEHGAMNVMSVSLLALAGGEIGLFYLVRRSWLDMTVALRRSADGGRSWSAAALCTPRPGYYVLNNDRATRLQSGRILLPVAEHINRVEENQLHFAPSRVCFFFSDDEGRSWQESSARLYLPDPANEDGLQEPGVVELAPGQLWGWARTSLGCQWAFTSGDNGLTWTEPAPSAFASPLSPLSLKRLWDGRLLTLWNPTGRPGDTAFNSRLSARTPLAAALSSDNGRTWGEPITVEDDPGCGYCYTAIHQVAADTVLLAYCAGGTADGCCLNRVRIRRWRLPGRGEHPDA